jgi:exodeoxyribonuclease-3
VPFAVKLVTWNVNSLKVRMPRVLEFLEAQRPDVACLQETKTEASAFPADELRAAGYESVHHSAGRWAGVAILAREGLGLSDPSAGLPGELVADEARWIEATVAGVRVASVYVTNGREVGTPTFDEKLAFLDAMAARAAALRNGPLVVAGDFNVAPADLDVYDPSAFAGSTHVTPDERGRLEQIMRDGGLVDAYRALHPDAVGYTWWDYRQGHFHRGLGLRIDLVLVSDALAGRLEACGIVRDFRKGTKPSDHAPLVTELAPA